MDEEEFFDFKSSQRCAPSQLPAILIAAAAIAAILVVNAPTWKKVAPAHAGTEVVPATVRAAIVPAVYNRDELTFGQRDAADAVAPLPGRSTPIWL